MNRARKAIRFWARYLGAGFHPDTEAGEYHPPLPAKVAQAYERDVVHAFEALGAAVYEVALEELRGLHLLH